MNGSVSPWVWTGGLFGVVTLTFFIVLQTAVLWWQGRTPSREANLDPALAGADVENSWATHAIIAAVGLGLMFMLVKDTPWQLLTVLGVLALVPYLYLQRKQAECQLWATRSSVARALDEMQVLASSRAEQSVLDAYPWLERGLKRNTLFQRFDARLVSLIGQGLALRGNKADLERIACEMQSEDLAQFVRRAWVKNDEPDEGEMFLRAADDIAERIHLDVEATAGQTTGQTILLWLGIIAVLIAAALIPLGGS